jgi:hypothetical protein
MESNSQIFTSTVFGNSSGLTREEMNQKNTETIELVYQEQVVSKLNNQRSIVPSNQRIAKD